MSNIWGILLGRDTWIVAGRVLTGEPPPGPYR